MNILFIGAHPDDLEFGCAGLAALYKKDGHRVRFLSMCNGDKGHFKDMPNELAARRYAETRKSAALLGVEYDVWNIPDCCLMADLLTRERTVRYIREFNPDVVFCHRTNDYHADHRNSALLVQDASYLLTVPHYCEDVPFMPQMPVIMYLEDEFKTPPFEPEVVVDIDSVYDIKFDMAACHESQVFEWLAYEIVYEDGSREMDRIPKDKAGKIAWMHGDKITSDTPDELLMSDKLNGYDARFAKPAARFRKELVERYGNAGKKVVYAEAYGISEYGRQLTPELKKTLFPY